MWGVLLSSLLLVETHLSGHLVGGMTVLFLAVLQALDLAAVIL